VRIEVLQHAGDRGLHDRLVVEFLDIGLLHDVVNPREIANVVEIDAIVGLRGDIRRRRRRGRRRVGLPHGRRRTVLLRMDGCCQRRTQGEREDESRGKLTHAFLRGNQCRLPSQPRASMGLPPWRSSK
jgi:hypothetical protein